MFRQMALDLEKVQLELCFTPNTNLSYRWINGNLGVKNKL